MMCTNVCGTVDALWAWPYKVVRILYIQHAQGWIQEFWKGGGGSDMNNQLGEGAEGGCAPSHTKRGSFWGSCTCALDDTLYHVGCC